MGIELPGWGRPLFRNDWRYLILDGGRGSGKTQTVASALAIRAAQSNMRIVCFRAYQNNIDESVKQAIEDRIFAAGLGDTYTILEKGIRNLKTGSTFGFKGLQKPGSLRGLEGVDLVWIDEAQDATRKALRSLIPTIRKAGSQIILTFNPSDASDPVWKMREKLADDPRAVIRRVNWRDNPWFPNELNEERLRDLRNDRDEYQHTWEGEFLRRSNALIFADKCDLGQDFECPAPWDTDDGRYYYGADFGFAADPGTLIRCWIKDDCLWIDRAAFGYGVQLDDIERMYDAVPGAREWPILADSARPDIIEMLRTRGFQIAGAEKGPGSVEDGITFLRSFRRIKIHGRLTEMAEEAMKYSYKVDDRTDQVLPIVVDRWNHGWDAVRYALSPLIKLRMGLTATDDEIDELDWVT